MKCPACKGTKRSLMLDITCMWCGGRGKVCGETATRYGAQLIGLADYGYIQGEYTLEEKRAQEAEGRAIIDAASAELNNA